jgi:hypothetical protein
MFDGSGVVDDLNDKSVLRQSSPGICEAYFDSALSTSLSTPKNY